MSELTKQQRVAIKLLTTEKIIYKKLQNYTPNSIDRALHWGTVSQLDHDFFLHYWLINYVGLEPEKHDISGAWSRLYEMFRDKVMQDG